MNNGVNIDSDHTPVLLGAIIYGTTVIFGKHPTSPHMDVNNATEVLNVTIYTASAVATLSWHHTTTPGLNTSPSPSRAAIQPKEPQIIIDIPAPTREPLHDGKKPQEGDDQEEEEETIYDKVSTPRPNHSAGKKGASKVATIHERDDTG